MGGPLDIRFTWATVHHDNRLVAIAPLTVFRYKGLRVLQWAGSKDFGYCDVLCETAEGQTALWQAIRQSGRYDIGLIKNLRSNSESYGFVGGFSPHRPRRKLPCLFK